MRRLAKALSAFTSGRSLPAVGRDVVAFAGRGGSCDVDGSGALAVGRVRLGVLAFAVFALGLMALAPATLAAPKSIQGFVGGAFGAAGGQFGQPRDVAVYEGTDSNAATDKIFVSEAVNNQMRIQRLDVDGNFERIWGRNVDGVNPSIGFEVCTVAASCQQPSSGGTGVLPGEFDDPTGIAIDQANGWVYVHDRDNLRIQKFDLDGNFLAMFGKGVNAGSSGNPDLCTNAGPPTDVCQKGTAGAAAGQLGATSQDVRGPAIDPTSGDVFVADPQNRRVLQFQSNGVFLRAWGWDVDKATVDNRFETCTANCGAGVNSSPTNFNGAFASNNPLSIAIDSNGILYASDNAPSSSTQRVTRFDTTPPPGAPGDATASLTTPIASPPLHSNGTTPTKGLEIDADSDGAGPDEEHLLVARDPSTGDTIVQEFDIPAVPTDPIGVGQLVDTHAFAPQQINGMGVSGGTGNVYLAISYTNSQAPALFSALGVPTNSSVHGLTVLNTPAAAAVPTAFTPSPIGSSTATLQGTLNPGGAAPIRYDFELSPDGTSYTSAGSASLSGTGSIPISRAVTGLDPNSTYRVRVTATRVTSLTNPATVTTSPLVIFVTAAAPPEAVTLPIGPRTDTIAELRGSVDPNGTATNYWFEYGVSASYGTKVPLTPAPAGAGNEALLLVEQLSGLLPNTTYHYRIVADGFGPAVNGADRIFSTLATKAPPALGNRAYELVSPADKAGGTGVGQWSGGAGGAGAPSGEAAHVGERFISRTTLGAILLDGANGYASDAALAERTPAGWLNRSPVTHGANSPQPFRFLMPNSASEDLSKIIWTSNFALLTPFPELASWPSAMYSEFAVDWAGRWEIVAPTDLAQMHSFSFGVGAQSALSRSVVSADGSHLAFTTGLPGSGTLKSLPSGLAGEGDPTHPKWNELLAGRAVYVVDQTAGLSDEFDGNGVYSNAGVCADDTLIPERNGSNLLEDQSCAAPLGLPAGPDQRLISPRGAALHPQVSDSPSAAENIISRDGSRIFFMSPDPAVGGVPAAGCTGTGAATACPPQLFVRQRSSDGTVTTRWISKAEDGLFGSQSADLTGAVRFAGASKDGEVVFFQTNSPLSADDPNGGVSVPGGVTTGVPSNSSWDLYAYALPAGPDGNPATPDADPAGGTLTRVSAGPAGSGDCNVVSKAEDGSLRFVAEDGSRAYFTCAAPLAGVSETADGTITAPGGTVSSADATNLYSYAADGGGAWEFVARLPRGGVIGDCATTDSEGTDSLLGTANLSTILTFAVGHCVRGTADGEFVTLWTAGRLTLDDPDEATIDAYAYDAATERLTRITAPQGGVGGSYLCNPYTGSGAAPPTQCNADSGFGGRKPLELLGVASRPTIPGDRIAFFQSRSRLVSEDVDNAYDVYQWRNGGLSLISTGNSAFDGGPGALGGAFYKGNDETGRNVYFASQERLSWQDSDGALDIYTARVGGGIPQPPTPPACDVLADACQGVAASPPVPDPASTASFSGDGNVAAKPQKPKPRKCAKGKVRRGGKCVAKKGRKAKGRKAERSAHHDRRATK